MSRFARRPVGLAALLAAACSPWVVARPAESGEPGAAAATAATGSNSWISSGTGNGWVSSNPGGAAVAPPGGVVGGGFGGAGAAGSGPIYLGGYPSFYFGVTPYGAQMYMSPGYVIGQGGGIPVTPVPMVPAAAVPAGQGGGLRLPNPERPQPVAARASNVRRSNPAKSREYVEIGDRSFRADNTKRAEERYRLALKSDPNSATPRVRLAQVALVRGRYEEAADHLREALAVEPGYLAIAPDIQKLFGEPADFERRLAALETHLQAEPNDRDAWFVLGAEWYLSGRSQRASDAFLRLTDRRPDHALAAFLDATSMHRADARPR